MNYNVCIDSGTSNTRMWLLDEKGSVLCSTKENVGSKDSALCGDRTMLPTRLKAMYDRLLSDACVEDRQVKDIMASGMLTCPYGFKEVPHVLLPVGEAELAFSSVRYFEDVAFSREIILVPGVKTSQKDISSLGNMRGEEVEVVGACVDNDLENTAVVLPGSHTHIAFVQGGRIVDCVSNFTGELFYALKESTILSPILSTGCSSLDHDMAALGVRNSRELGFNRAIYILNAMRVMQSASQDEMFSYAEGVINGGLANILEMYVRQRWTECTKIAIISDEFMFELLSCIFSTADCLPSCVWLENSQKESFSLKGMKRILSVINR